MAARGQSTRTVARMIAYVRSAGAVAAATALAGAIVSGPASGTGGSEHSAGSHPRSAAVTAEAERETTHTLHATVTSKRSASVHLVVRAHHGDRVVRTEQRQVRVVAGRATRVRVTVSTVQRAPRLTKRLVPTRSRPGDRFTVTRVRWTHRFPSVEPTPDPTPEPTPDPAPDPSAPLLSNGCAYSLRGIPGCGAYLGQAYGSNTDPTSLEADLGGRLGLRRTYFRADQVDSAVRIATTDLAAGRLPWVSFKLPHSWSDMTAGAGDAWVKSLVARFGRLDGPVWLAFHHEPEGDGPIADWRRMQERLAPLVRAEENLAFTVIVTGWNQLYGDPTYSLDAIWPRGVTVDVAGFDVYNQLGVVKDGKENTKGTDLQASYFSKLAPWAREHKVAWALAETGFTDKASLVDPDWIQRTYRQLIETGGIGFAYFNTTLNSIAPWHLGTEAKVAGWRRAQVGTPLLPLP